MGGFAPSGGLGTLTGPVVGAFIIVTKQNYFLDRRVRAGGGATPAKLADFQAGRARARRRLTAWAD